MQTKTDYPFETLSYEKVSNCYAFKEYKSFSWNISQCDFAVSHKLKKKPDIFEYSLNFFFASYKESTLYTHFTLFSFKVFIDLMLKRIVSLTY